MLVVDSVGNLVLVLNPAPNRNAVLIDERGGLGWDLNDSNLACPCSRHEGL